MRVLYDICRCLSHHRSAHHKNNVWSAVKTQWFGCLAFWLLMWYQSWSHTSDCSNLIPLCVERKPHSQQRKVYNEEGLTQKYSKCCCNYTDCWIRCHPISNRYYYFDIILKTASIIIYLSTPWKAIKNSLATTNIENVPAKLTAAKRVNLFLQFDDIISM